VRVREDLRRRLLATQVLVRVVLERQLTEARLDFLELPPVGFGHAQEGVRLGDSEWALGHLRKRLLHLLWLLLSAPERARNVRQRLRVVRQRVVHLLHVGLRADPDGEPEAGGCGALVMWAAGDVGSW